MRVELVQHGEVTPIRDTGFIKQLEEEFEEEDRLGWLISELTGDMALTKQVELKIHIGDVELPCYVFGELHILLEELENLLTFIRVKEETEYLFDLFEQSFESKTMFTKNGEVVKMEVLEMVNSGKQPVQTIQLKELLDNLHVFWQGFLRLAKLVCPDYYEHDIFTTWKNTTNLRFKDASVNFNAMDSKEDVGHLLNTYIITLHRVESCLLNHYDAKSYADFMSNKSGNEKYPKKGSLLCGDEELEFWFHGLGCTINSSSGMVLEFTFNAAKPPYYSISPYNIWAYGQSMGFKLSEKKVHEGLVRMEEKGEIKRAIPLETLHDVYKHIPVYGGWIHSKAYYKEA